MGSGQVPAAVIDGADRKDGCKKRSRAGFFREFLESYPGIFSAGSFGNMLGHFLLQIESGKVLPGYGLKTFRNFFPCRPGSAIEHEPAHIIAQSLVVEHEFPDPVRELCTLPLALTATGLVTLVFGSRRPYGPDRIGRRPQLMSGHMTHRPGLPGGMSRFLCGAGHFSCGRVRIEGVIAGQGPGDPTPCPCTRLFDRPARTVVARSHLLEERQYVLRTIGSPDSKEMMIGVRQDATAPDGDEPGIPLP
jgi:hypothetical protein